MSLCLIRSKIYIAFHLPYYVKFIEINPEHHIGCILANYVESFTDSFAIIFELNTCKLLQSLKLSNLSMQKNTKSFNLYIFIYKTDV
jgi:hypothetical protein